MLFNGESYDYIGSQRIVYDMENGVFPIKSAPNTDYYIPPIYLNDISLLIELNQLSQTNEIFAYAIEDNFEIRNFVTNTKKYAQDYNFKITEGDAKIVPPSSLQSFLKANNSIPGIVLTDHNSTYRNRFYNSIYDNPDNLQYTYYNSSETDQIPSNSIQHFIANVSNMLARSVFQEITHNEYRGKETADVVIVMYYLQVVRLNLIIYL